MSNMRIASGIVTATIPLACFMFQEKYSIRQGKKKVWRLRSMANRFGLYLFGYFLVYACFYIATGMMSLAKSGGLVQPAFLSSTIAIIVLAGSVGLELVCFLLDKANGRYEE